MSAQRAPLPTSQSAFVRLSKVNPYGLSWLSSGERIIVSQEVSMLLRLLAVPVAGLALCLSPALPASAAGEPDRMTFDLDQSFTDDFLTEACGTEVVTTISGTREVTLWRNEAGLVVRELDRFPGAFTTWSAPETGQSIKTRTDLVSHWDYGAGAVLGGPVTFTFHGMFFHLPESGYATFAGREVSVGDIDGFEDGVPIVDDGTLVSLVGHFTEDFDFVDAVCSSLT